MLFHQSVVTFRQHPLLRAFRISSDSADMQIVEDSRFHACPIVNRHDCTSAEYWQ